MGDYFRTPGYGVLTGHTFTINRTSSWQAFEIHGTVNGKTRTGWFSDTKTWTDNGIAAAPAAAARALQGKAGSGVRKLTAVRQVIAADLSTDFAGIADIPSQSHTSRADRAGLALGRLGRAFERVGGVRLH
jgi:hypothetical protein